MQKKLLKIAIESSLIYPARRWWFPIETTNQPDLQSQLAGQAEKEISELNDRVGAGLLRRGGFGVGKILGEELGPENGKTPAGWGPQDS